MGDLHGGRGVVEWKGSCRVGWGVCVIVWELYVGEDGLLSIVLSNV